MTASGSPTTVMESHQRFGTFAQNTMIQEIACGPHEFLAWMVHDGLLQINPG